MLQVELEIMLPEEMSVKESHDIALMLQHKVPSVKANCCYAAFGNLTQTCLDVCTLTELREIFKPWLQVLATTPAQL